MDSRRACPSYEAGFDACDPLGSVLEWTGREPARILRRRCRSEGVERSPYEDAIREATLRYHRALPNKCHFTLNSERELHFDRFRHECLLPAAENGDYVMSRDPEPTYLGYQPGRSRFYRTSPTRPLLVTTLSNTKVDESRLPKVEELLERVDQEMMDVQVAKQPLKSILNNPLPNSPLHGILKKPKIRSCQESKSLIEGRRRQRASSESDNLYANFHIGCPIPGYDRLTSFNMKRAKDNSGIGYSYGSAIASLGTPAAQCKSPSKNHKITRCTCKEQLMVVKHEDMQLLRTSAINSDTVHLEPLIDMLPRQDSPTPTCPAVSPALPVSSVTTIPVPKKGIKTKKKLKQKVTKMKSCSRECSMFDLDDDDCVCKDNHKHGIPTEGNNYHAAFICSKSSMRSQSRCPSLDDSWQMETDAALAEIDKLEKRPTVLKKEKEIEKEKLKVKAIEEEKLIEQTSVTSLSTKLNGAVNVTPKKHNSKEKLNIEKGKESNPFVAALHTTNPFKLSVTRKESPMCLPDTVTSCLRQSLFPRVPPYLKFIGHDETPSLKIPLPIQKHLKWKLTTITPIVVKRTLTNSGFRLVKSECDTSECPQEETIEWIGIWGKHMKSIMFRAIKDGQKMNHFPGTFQIGRKDRLWRNLQKLVNKHGLDEFGIMPKTYVLPNDLKLLKHDWEKYAAMNEKWIIKPPASARGTGIKVVSKWTQIPKKRPVVVQRYVSKPYLINGSKFDLRLYVLVTSVHPLRIFLYKDGLARFASVKYNDELASLNDRYMHLTNYSINRLSKNYTPNEDFAACEGHKWTLQTLFQYLKTEKRVNTEALWESMKDLVIKTIIAGEASISSLTKANITSRYNCYELFGIDVLLDEDLKPWLLEVNISPSLHSASPLDIHVKGPLVTTVLNIAQFQVPVKTNLEMLSKDKPHKLAGLPYDSRLYTVYLSKEERDKHIIYTNMEERDMYLRDILSTLTADDVRHLIQAEDELTQAGDMERVFPTHDSHKYLAFLTGPRYYNRLFDAWEARYGRNRDPGIELLRTLCEIGYHLEVPPVPLKLAAGVLSALDGCRMTWTRPPWRRRSGPQWCPSRRWSSLARAPAPPRSRGSCRARGSRGSARSRCRSSRAPSAAPPRRKPSTDLNENCTAARPDPPPS